MISYSWYVFFLHRDIKLTTVNRLDYFYENQRDTLRNYSTQAIIKPRRESSESINILSAFGTPTHAHLHIQHSRTTKRKPFIPGSTFQINTKEWTLGPMFWFVWGLLWGLISVSLAQGTDGASGKFESCWEQANTCTCSSAVLQQTLVGGNTRKGLRGSRTCSHAKIFSA